MLDQPRIQAGGDQLAGQIALTGCGTRGV